MRCGAKCFIVEYEQDGQVKNVKLNSRTPAEARKILRLQTEGKATVLQVKKA